MGLSFRKSVRFGPLRVNFSRSGVGLSAGVRGARVGVGPRGTYVTFSGGGFSYRAKLNDVALPPPPTPTIASPSTGWIPTASVEQLAVIGPDAMLQEVQSRLNRTNLFKVYLWTAGGLVLVTIGLPGLFLVLVVLAIIGGVFVRRWDRERRTARILYDVDNDEIVGRLALCNAAGEALGQAAALWHIYSSVGVRDPKYNAGAGTLIQRTGTRCAAGSLSGIELNVEPWSVPVGPQQILLLPDCLMVREGRRLAAVPYAWLSVHHETTRFIEEGAVPRDSRAVGQTWRFVNKNGGPDLRFNNNCQLPVLEYGELKLFSSNGLQIVLQASNPAATYHASCALQELIRIARSPVPDFHGQDVPRPIPQMSSEAVARPAPTPPSTRQSGLTVPLAAIEPNRAAPLPPAPVLPPAPPIRPTPAPTPLPQPRQAPPLPAPQARPTGDNARPVRPAASSGARRFFGPSEVIVVAGRTIQRPLTFVSDVVTGADASTIVTPFNVGTARWAENLPYWPSYLEASPNQRARYLDWMAGGRVDPAIDIGYIFMFFYGLEWRVLRDGADNALAVAEVQRLLQTYADRSASLRSYLSEFVAFSSLRRLQQLTEEELTTVLAPILIESETATTTLLAWHYLRGQPLGAQLARRLVPILEGAKRSVVATRAADELDSLFEARYREQLGSGLVLDAAKRPSRVEYHPASGSLRGMGQSLALSVPHVLGRGRQFGRIIEIWNACIDDLRKASSLKHRNDGELTAEGWAALPPELRQKYDHPARDEWDALIAAAPRLGEFHLLSCSKLANVSGLGAPPKLSAAQLRRVAEIAADVGYALEPDGRVHRKGAQASDEMLVWRSADTSSPDQKLYASALSLLTLKMAVALADGTVDERETRAMIDMLADVLALDEGLRKRLAALQHLLARQPGSATAVAKKLQATRSRFEIEKVGRVLVAVAAVDGEIAEKEQDVLRSLYKALGLREADLSAAIAASGARLARDRVVEVRPATTGRAGEPIPSPPGEARPVELDQAAIAAILADTRDVAAMLAEVLDQDNDGEDADREVAPALPVAEDAQRPNAGGAFEADGLDVRYHAALEELLTKPIWTMDEVRALSNRRKLMPGAILDAVNSWSDEMYGDFLIEDSEHWHVRSQLLKGQMV
jgi:tellurite resistance protein